MQDEMPKHHYYIEIPLELTPQPNIPTVENTLDDLLLRQKTAKTQADSVINPTSFLSILKATINDVGIGLENKSRIISRLDGKMAGVSYESAQSDIYSARSLNKVIRAIEKNNLSGIPDIHDVDETLKYLVNLINQDQILIDNLKSGIPPHELSDRRHETAFRAQGDPSKFALHYEERLNQVVIPLMRLFITEYLNSNVQFITLPYYSGLCNLVDLEPTIPVVEGLDINKIIERVIDIHAKRAIEAKSYDPNEENPKMSFKTEDYPYPKTDGDFDETITDLPIKKDGITSIRHVHYKGRQPDLISLDNLSSESYELKARVAEDLHEFVKTVSVRVQRSKKDTSQKWSRWNIGIQGGDLNFTWQDIVKSPNDKRLRYILKKLGLT